MAGEIAPRVATIRAAPQSGVFAAAFGGVWVAAALPQCGVQDARIAEVHAEVGGAGVVALFQNQIPGAPAVLRSVNAALRVRPPGMAQRRDVDEVWVGG